MTLEQELMSIVRLLLAVFLGGLIGLERQIHGRPAGLRTHILVCLGSALIITLAASFGPNVDPGRAVAGIVTGVGFLGAGVIVKSKEIVRGLTTAACIWFVAALGVAVGQGLYVTAFAGTAIAIVVLTLLARFAHRVPAVGYNKVQIRAAVEEIDSVEAKCRGVLAELGYRVAGLSARLDRDGDSAELTLRLRARGERARGLEPSRRLLAIPGVRDVAWD
jgi:putative Mg2+ transporter-C (MgtC) family protein